MTVTVKLDPALEERLRQRAASHDTSTSDVIRAALTAYLDEDGQAAMPTSAFALGQGLFGRHGGAADLASNRKQALADVWGEKRRGPRS